MPSLAALSEAHADWIRDACAGETHALRRESGLGGVSLEDLESLLFALGPFPADAVHKVRSPDLPVDLGGQRSEAAYASFAAGFTLVFREAHRRVPAIGLLAGDLSRHLGVEVRANLYLTPPRSQGFAAHFDRHDVLVLQLHGDKHWNVFPHIGHRPLAPTLLSPPQKLLHEATSGHDGAFSVDRAEEVTVATGDLLVVPRGLPHQAKAADGPSLHCTFALLPPSRAEAVSLMAFAASTADAAMLEPWDPQLPLEPAAPAGHEAEQVAYALELLRQQSRVALPGRYLRTLCSLHELDAATPLERRPGVQPWLGPVGGARQFVFAGQRFWVAPELEATFEFLADRLRFVAGDLPLPGYDPVQFCRDMVVRGLLQVAG